MRAFVALVVAMLFGLMGLAPAGAQSLNNKSLADFIRGHESTHLRRSQFDTDAKYAARMNGLERPFVLRFRPPTIDGEPLETVAQYQLGQQRLTLIAWTGGETLEHNELFDGPYAVRRSGRAPVIAPYQLALLEQHIEKKPPVPLGTTQMLPRRLITPGVFFVNQNTDFTKGLRAVFDSVPPEEARALAQHIEFRLHGRTVAYVEPPRPKAWPERWVWQRPLESELISDEVLQLLMPAVLQKVEFVDTRTGKVRMVVSAEEF